jgi:hypothetical protein
MGFRIPLWEDIAPLPVGHQQAAAEVVLFVSGPEKAPVLAGALDQAVWGQQYPVRGVRPRRGIKRWMLDASAAAGIRAILGPVEHDVTANCG